MRKSALVCFMMFSGSLAFGQLDSNSITVNASRSTSLQPDQAVFAITVQSGFSTSLDDVIAALQGSGITQANFAGVATNSLGQQFVPPAPPMLSWAFTLQVPLSKTKDKLASLAALQQTMAQGTSGLTLSFGIQGTQVSTQLLQSQMCSLPDLVTDARAQAQKMADAAGVTLGSILALSSGTSNVVANVNQPIFAGVTGFITGSLGVAPEFAPPCALTVKFGLVRFQ
jgi:hypothetical protein